MTRDQLAQRDVFLAEIRDDPDDDVPRLILGDWLADQGDPRGELIQIDVRLAATPEGPERVALEERRRQLLRDNAMGWLGPLLDVVSEWRWVRGMLHVTARAERLLGEDGGAALHANEFAWVEGVRLAGDFGGMTHACWRALLVRVSVLDLSDASIDNNRVGHLLRYRGQLAGLRWLRLAGNRIGRAGVIHLAGCRHLERLTRLDLSGNGLTDEEAQVLVESPHLNSLRRLNLAGAQLSLVMRARLNKRFGPGVVRVSRPAGS